MAERFGRMWALVELLWLVGENYNRSRHAIQATVHLLIGNAAGRPCRLAERARSLHPPIDAAFVFGSLARGAASPASDVDVFMVGDIDFTEVVRLFYPVEGTLGRDVNPVVLTARAWRTRVLEHDPFLSDVLTKPKLFLIGSEHVLAELVGISLDVVVPDRRHIQRRLAAIRRNLADAHIDGLSNENRFDVAYKSIMQLSLLVLHACGYRTLGAARPGR